MKQRWHLAPVLALRQTGFPFELTALLAAEELRDWVDRLTVAAAALTDEAAEIKRLLRLLRLGGSGRFGSAVGQLLPMRDDDLAEVARHLSPEERAVLDRYQRHAADLEAHWSGYQAAFERALAGTRAAVVAAFHGDDLLREVLMLSNDLHFPQYQMWLDQRHESFDDKRGRSMTDLLTRYLQRVATKNETHSHFGPVAAGRFEQAGKGISWEVGEPVRVAFFSYWAADRLAARISTHPDLMAAVKPRSRPWAFRRGARVTLYAFTTETGFASDWRFTRAGEGTVDPAAAWLFDRCDGQTTVASLSAEFDTAVSRGELPDDRTMLQVLETLVSSGWVVARFEIPIGEPHPLQAIEEQLPEGATGARELIGRLNTRLADFCNGSSERRPSLIAQMKAEYEDAAGHEANRGSGRHYADRSIFFEECHSKVRGLRLGEDMAAFIRDQLSPVYEIALLGPRLRLWRENRILASWLDSHFGAEKPVPLDVFYERYFEHRHELLAAVEAVDSELDQLDQQLTAVLLSGPTETRDGATISYAPTDELSRLIDANTVRVPAVCNPDVMLAATDVAAIGQGDFYAVVGDCHALREVLTHTSFTPLLADHLPELTESIFGLYQDVLQAGEVLCDMARSHPNKTGSQVRYPCPDVEIFGRSPKPRSQVIHPDAMYVISQAGVASLKVHGLEGSLRLTAPPAGGPSIRQDPLSPFSFPRHFGGVGLRAGHLNHVPRIMHGERVVIHRETWRVPAGDLCGQTATGRGEAGDAAEFFAAQRLRRRLGLPRYVFAKVPREPKPMFVDFDSPLLVRQLSRMARATRETVTLSEMLPGPDQLWLDIDGKRHTSELRCALFSS